MQTSSDNAAQIFLNAFKADPESPGLDIGPVVTAYLSAVARGRAMKPLKAAAESARTDKQVSASSSTGSGSTSVVDRPGLAQLLGFAIEHGAISQSVQGNTVTLSSSPYAIAAWLGGGDTAENYAKYGETYGRVGFSANFNLIDTNNPTLSATRKQLNEWTAKIRLGKDHSGRSKDARDAFEKHLGDTLQTMATSQATILSAALGKDKSFAHLHDDIVLPKVKKYLVDHVSLSDAEKKQGLSKIILDEVFSSLQTISLTDDAKRVIASSADAFDKAAQSLAADSKDLDDAIAELSKLPSYSLVYAQEQPSIGNNYSALKFIYAQSPPNGMQITANVSGSLYHHPNPSKNQDTFRDFTGSLELLQKIGRSPFLRDPVNKDQISVSFSGRYQRMPENKGIKGKKADIAVAGAKFEIPVAPGVSFPISVTYANATELIKEAHVSGNFGITFDLDKLKALVSK